MFYTLHGINIKSVLPLQNCPCLFKRGRHAVEIFEGKSRFFSNLTRNFPTEKRLPSIFYHRFSDSSEYIRFFRFFHFWIHRDGRKIAYQILANPSKQDPKAIFASLINCLQTSALSFSLLKMGRETLHSTAVYVDGQSVGFIGESGDGKSTLAASFIQGGFSLMSDDVLAVRSGRSSFMAASGNPRIKLFSETAKRIFKKMPCGSPLYPGSPKLIFPLKKTNRFTGDAPLKALYLLRAPEDRRHSGHIKLRGLNRKRAALEIIKSTFNCLNQSAERLRAQFLFAADLAEKIPVIALTYPRDLNRLPEVREAILRDLKSR